MGMALRKKDMATSTSIRLRYRQLLNLVAGDGDETSVISKSGRLWITITNQTRDIVLSPGESIAIPTGLQVVVEALDDAEFSVKSHRASS